MAKYLILNLSYFRFAVKFAMPREGGTDVCLYLLFIL